MTARAEAGGPSGRRRALAYGLVGLACLVALVAALSVWVERQLLDTDRWTETSTELLEREDVREAIALRLVDAVYDGEPGARLEQRLPPALAPLAPQIAGALGGLATDRIEVFLGRPAVQSLWEQVNARAHARLVAVLRSEDDGLVESSGGDVVLDLSPIAARLRGELGLGPPPEGAGQITIMHSDELAAAQDAVAVIDVLSPFMGFAVAVLLAVAVYIVPGARREVVRAAGAGLLAVGLVLLVVRRVVGDAVVDALASPASDGAATAVWLVATSVLGDIAVSMVVLGALALAWAVLCGPTRPARWLRARIAPALRTQPVAVHAGVLLVALAVLAWGPTGAPRRLVLTLIILALVVGGVEALRRQVLREGGAPTG